MALGLDRDPKRDVYYDLHEVIWKYPMAGAHRRIVQLLANNNLLHDASLRASIFNFVVNFNSNHEQAVFDERLSRIQVDIRQRLNELGFSYAASEIDSRIQAAKHAIADLEAIVARIEYVPDKRPQTFVADGEVRIAGHTLESFANQSSYIKATLSMMCEPSRSLVAWANGELRRGFALTDSERQLVESAKCENWEFPELITSILVHQQNSHRYRSLLELEYSPMLPDAVNAKRMRQAVGEAYFLLGKILVTVAAFSAEQSVPSEMERGFDAIHGLLKCAGKAPTNRQVDAVRIVALAHCSHGLNSGELTARLAGSVRTTFPRALISSFNIRSGALHAGAVRECMIQIQAFLASGASATDYLASKNLASSKFYGFGHRIHKTSKDDPPSMIGKDPRVRLYIEAARQGFPEKAELIERILSYAKEIREARPSLGANTDFGAAVLFHALELSPSIADGFFAAFRCAGICANVVNELRVKGNSRRPPFPETLSFDW